LGFLLSEVVYHGGESPCSTAYPEDSDLEVDSGVLDPETCGPVACKTESCGPVTCEPVVTEAGGLKIYVTIVFYGIT
jgi:hypothetical protein